MDILLVAVHVGESEPVSILIHVEEDVKVKHGHIGSGYVSRSFNDSDNTHTHTHTHTHTQQELLTIQKAQYLYINTQRVLKRKQVMGAGPNNY